ncbi:MAG TPA: T9SS type A sorting domain-containing protein [Caldithrix sp.]|nr:T9SS type A sorting domain-containing protein [Caldithrix sp.]
MHKNSLIILSMFLSIISLLILSASDKNDYSKTDPRLETFKSTGHLKITWISERIYEVKDKLTGNRSIYHLSNFIQTAEEDTVDQIIDLSQYDPDDYAHMYTHQTTFALGSSSGYPMIISDVDDDSLIELTGVWYDDYSIPFSIAAIYEQTPNGTFERRKLFQDDSLNITQPFGDYVTDLDNDSLPEINITAFELYGTFNGVVNIEADSLYAIPDSLNFMSDSLIGYSGSLRIDDLDRDGLKECIGFDITRQLFIAEFDTASKKFEKVFTYDAPQEHIYNFGIGDGDLDGKTDFICGSAFGNVYVFENISDNQYALVWTDTLPFSNANLSAATNDIDQNGKPEFFIGSDGYYQQYAGTYLYWYESVADNTYERKKRILIAGTGFYSENGLHPHDMDGDGIKELIFDFALPNQMFILKWNPNAYFDMYYYSYVSDYRELDAVTIHRPNGQINPNLIFSTYYYPELPVLQSHYYKFNSAGSITDSPNIIPKIVELYQNYPNPFNGFTTLRFNLRNRSVISLIIYDITGKEVKRLINNQRYAPGEHEINWNGLNHNGKEVSSGIYIYNMKAGEFTLTRKMILLR